MVAYLYRQRDCLEADLLERRVDNDVSVSGDNREVTALITIHDLIRHLGVVAAVGVTCDDAGDHAAD